MSAETPKSPTCFIHKKDYRVAREQERAAAEVFRLPPGIEVQVREEKERGLLGARGDGAL